VSLLLVDPRLTSDNLFRSQQSAPALLTFHMRIFMRNLPFAQPGRFWRGNLHTHTTNSDGTRSPEDVCAYYRDNGYHFVALTDHFMEQFNYPLTDASACQTDEFLPITGAELHAGQTSVSGLWHILAVGMPLDFPRNVADESGPQIAARAMAAGAFVACAHPAWYNLCEADVLTLGKVHAIEIYNGISADHNDRPDSWYMLDTLLAQGYRYWACATDDAHFHPRHNDVMRGWVMVRSETLERDSILDALKAGHFYSSTGPQINDIQVIPGDKVIIQCSPVDSIFVTGRSWMARQVHGHGLRGAELSLRDFDGEYCRVTVRDGRGGRAWSNPIWFE
jgi:hypothetical protein